MAYTDDELLEARELPCRVCGAPIRIDGQMRIRVLRARIGFMQKMGWTDCGWGGTCPFCDRHTLDADLAELRTLPGIVCRYGEHRNPIPPREAICAHCGEAFPARRSTARFCSGRCRVAAHRARASLESG